MKDYKAIWKKLAEEKRITRYDVIKYCILKALTAKSNIDKKYLAAHFLEKAFTPVKNKKKLANGRKPWDILHKNIPWEPTKENFIIFGHRGDDVFETDEEFRSFIELWNATAKENNIVGRQYMFFFVRKDIPSIHYVVQAAHVAYVAGQRQFEKQNNPEEIHFVIMEAQDENDLNKKMDFLEQHNIEYQKFVEPDLENQVTAIATEVLDIRYKDIFKEQTLLKI